MMIDIQQVRQNFSGSYGIKGKAATDGKSILLVKDYSKPIMISDNLQKEIDSAVQQALGGIVGGLFRGGNMTIKL